jgi:hypothetical protein
MRRMKLSTLEENANEISALGEYGYLLEYSARTKKN